MHSIRKWVQERGSFKEGLDLYRQYGDGKDLRFFEKALKNRFIPPSVKSRLETALKALTAEQTQALPTIPHDLVKEEPVEVLKLRVEGKKLKKAESFLHAQLVITSKAESSEERKQKLYTLASQIMEIEKELDEVYDQIRAYEQDGILPIADKQKIVKQTVEKMKKRDSLRPRIYKIKKALKKPNLDELQRQVLELELQEKEETLAQIEEELGLS